MKIINTLIIALLAIAINVNAQTDFNSSWNGAYKIESADKDFKMKFGGRIQYFTFFGSQDAAVDNAVGVSKNGSEFRRLRFFNSGTIYGNTSYKMEVDFAGGGVSIKDAYVSFEELPLFGVIQAGHFKEPFSLEELTSSNDITFMERPTGVDFAPSRNNGVMFQRNLANNRISIAGGMFQDVSGSAIRASVDNNFNYTARITGLPIYKEENGKSLVHLGLAYSARTLDNDVYRFTGRPENHLAAKFLDSDTIENVSSQNLIGLEFALLRNAWSLKSEYIINSINTSSTNYQFAAYYAELGCFITGEIAGYDTGDAKFKRANPSSNYGSESGFGAIQLAVRYSVNELNDKDVIGGNQNIVSGIVNWYVNPAVRIGIQQSLATLDGVGSANFTSARVQVVF